MNYKQICLQRILCTLRKSVTMTEFTGGNNWFNFHNSWVAFSSVQAQFIKNKIYCTSDMVYYSHLRNLPLISYWLGGHFYLLAFSKLSSLIWDSSLDKDSQRLFITKAFLMPVTPINWYFFTYFLCFCNTQICINTP